MSEGLVAEIKFFLAQKARGLGDAIDLLEQVVQETEDHTVKFDVVEGED